LFLRLSPLDFFQFHHQINPLIDQFTETFVVRNLLTHFVCRFLPYEPSAALSSPRVAELVIGPVPLGIFRIFAAACRIAANVILLTQASRVHGAQIGQLLLNGVDLMVYLFLVHADIIAELSDFVNKKMTA
jgi:hypothetical protein